MSGADLAHAALELVGTRFRWLGRDPATGLDCLGVLVAALARCGRPVVLPRRYPLRRTGLPDLDALAQAAGLVVTSELAAPGDVLLVRPAPLQVHLAIHATASRVVHAHAAARRVVLGPPAPDWHELGRWRLP
jgi:cell wall-associated NlpC family hydrolase